MQRSAPRKRVKGAFMKGTRNFMDLGNIFDEIFEATKNLENQFHRKFNNFNPDGGGFRDGQYPFGKDSFPFGKHFFDENIDYYPNYSYPPMNVFMAENKTLVFEFALAGFNEKDINLSFQGDYMIFTAKIEYLEKEQSDENNDTYQPEENVRYFKRRLKMKDIERQKYFVPLDKYAQEKVKAVFKNGILRVSIPPKDEPDQNSGIKIEIVKDGN
jgi:HSP20 family molecular chaperone IbpA